MDFPLFLTTLIYLLGWCFLYKTGRDWKKSSKHYKDLWEEAVDQRVVLERETDEKVLELQCQVLELEGHYEIEDLKERQKKARIRFEQKRKERQEDFVTREVARRKREKDMDTMMKRYW